MASERAALYPSRMLDERDLKIEVFRSRDHVSGATDRAVRVTHIPSGIVAAVQGGHSEADEVASAIAEIERQLAEEAS